MPKANPVMPPAADALMQFRTQSAPAGLFRLDPEVLDKEDSDKSHESTDLFSNSIRKTEFAAPRPSFGLLLLILDVILDRDRFW